MPIPGIRHKLYSVAAVRRIVEQGVPETNVSVRKTSTMPTVAKTTPAARLDQRIAALRTEVSAAEREPHGISPAMPAESGVHDVDARDADCTRVAPRDDLTDTTQETIMAAIHAGTMRAAYIVQPETTPTPTP